MTPEHSKYGKIYCHRFGLRDYGDSYHNRRLGENVTIGEIGMPKSIADWASVLSLAIALGSIIWGFWQRHQRRHQTETLVTFLHGLKPAIQGENKKAVIEQINDMLERLEPPTK